MPSASSEYLEYQEKKAAAAPTMSDPMHPDLPKVAQKLVADGPHKMEKTPRRVRCTFDGDWLFDTTSAFHVWEHPYFPQIYVPTAAIKEGVLTKKDAVDDHESAFHAVLKSKGKETDRVVVFEKGDLKDLTRIEFDAVDGWFEEDAPIYYHFKDPYKRVDILPSARRITIKVDGVVVADSTLNMFLYETMLRPRYYMPKSAIQWKYTTPSSTTSVCPYKGTAEYYNLNVNGKEIKDAIWWYRLATHESALIVGMACFYNEKVETYVDGVKEEI
ncbi:MAG: hypothetical protein Q9170_005219 [Blastenia crenularia]